MVMEENADIREIDAMRLIHKAIRDKKTMPVDVELSIKISLTSANPPLLLKDRLHRKGWCCMDNRIRAQEWQRLVEQDLDSAGYLLNMRPVPLEIVCYLCQQSAWN